MFKFNRAEEVLITPAVAEALNKHYEGQRLLNANKVRDYAAAMRRGEWQRCRISLASIKGQGREEKVVDGQHTLAAIIASGVSIKGAIEHYTCAEQRDFGMLYNIFDKGSRTPSDNARVVAMAYNAQYGTKYPTQFIQDASLALWSAQNYGGKASTWSVEPRFGMIYDSMDTTAWLFEQYRGASSYFKHVPVLTGMVACYKANPEKATIFWARVSSGEGLRKGNPEYILREFLTREKSRVKTGDKRTAILKLETYNKCIVCWNAFIRQESMRLLKWNGNKTEALSK